MTMRAVRCASLHTAARAQVRPKAGPDDNCLVPSACPATPYQELCPPKELFADRRTARKLDPPHRVLPPQGGTAHHQPQASGTPAGIPKQGVLFSGPTLWQRRAQKMPCFSAASANCAILCQCDPVISFCATVTPTQTRTRSLLNALCVTAVLECHNSTLRLRGPARRDATHQVVRRSSLSACSPPRARFPIQAHGALLAQ